MKAKMKNKPKNISTIQFEGSKRKKLVKVQKTKMITVPVGRLEINEDIWPRSNYMRLDTTNLALLKEKVLSGTILDPILINQYYQIIDGVYRKELYTKMYGVDYKVVCIIKWYETESQMRNEAAELNIKHGLCLSPKDKVHVIIVAREKGDTDPIELARALGMRIDKVQEYFKKRTLQLKNGKIIPLPFGASMLAGVENPTNAQEIYAKNAIGIMPSQCARILRDSLKANAYRLSTSEIQLLIELNIEIVRVLKGVKK